MEEYNLGRKDAETNYFLWMCMYNTSLKSLRHWLKSQNYSKEYIKGYIAYFREMEGYENV